jgi:hypothetical protein
MDDRQGLPVCGTRLSSTRAAIRSGAAGRYAEDHCRGRAAAQENPEHLDYTVGAAKAALEIRREAIRRHDAALDTALAAASPVAPESLVQSMRRVAEISREVAYWEGVLTVARRLGT